MRRLLGIDVGDRRIGLAIADETGDRARPLVTIRRGRKPADDVRRLAELIAQHDVGELIVGLPLEASGRDGAQAGVTRQWAEVVQSALGLPMSYRDERLSSHRAEQALGPMPRGRSGGPPTAHQRETYRARVDREAAAIILQDELDARLGESPGTTSTASGGSRTRSEF